MMQGMTKDVELQIPVQMVTELHNANEIIRRLKTRQMMDCIVVKEDVSKEMRCATSSATTTARCGGRTASTASG